MADASTISVLIKARDMASEAFQKVENNAGKMAGGIAKHRRAIGMAMTGMGAAMTGFAVMSVKAASDLEESMNAVNVIFTDGAKVIHEFGENSARSVGLSTAKFNELASVTGALLKDVGLPMEEVAGLTTDLAIRAADMASVMNTSVEDALSAVGQALRGETEAIRRYAGDVTDASLQTFALSEGIQKQVSEMTEQEKRLLRVSLIMEQTNSMAGDFANTSESLANRMRIAKAEFANTSAEIGTVLLPIVTLLVEKIQVAIQAVADWIKEHPTLTKWITIVAAGLGAVMLVLGPILLILPGIVTAVGLLSAAFAALSISMGPVTLAIIGIAALVTAAIIVWKKWDDMSTKVKIAVVAIGIAIGPVTALIVLGIAAWKNWDKIVDTVRKSIGIFTKQVIGFIIKLGEGFLAITKWIPSMGDTRRAIEGTMDTLRDSQVTIENWGNNSEEILRETGNAWGEMEDTQMKAAQSVMFENASMTQATADAAMGIENSLADAGGSYDNLTQTVKKNVAEQTVELRTFAETRTAIAQLNADAERAIRDESAMEFRKWIEDGKAAREEQAADEARITQQISDTWSTFKQNQDVTIQALKESNISFTDLVEELAIKHDVTVTQMADRLAIEGVRMGDTWGLLQQQGKTSMDGLIIEIETASQTVAEKMAGLGRIMSGTSFTDAAGNPLGFNAPAMEAIGGMSQADKLEALTGDAAKSFSTENLGQLIGTSGPGAVQDAASDLIMERWEGNQDRIDAELLMLERGLGEHDSGMRLVARNLINSHLKSRQKRNHGIEMLSRDMTHSSWAQADAIDIARQLAPQVYGQQRELLQLYSSGQITAFAGGGIVTKPTLGLVGEAGPEAIVPLGRGGGMGTTNNFHFHGSVYGVEDLKEAVVEAVRDHAISGGFSGVFAEA